MTGWIVIDDARPRTPTGRYPAKAVVGESVRVSADIFKDGHDLLAARVRWGPADDNAGGDADDAKWREAPMRHLNNDRWEGVIQPDALGMHEFVIEAWTDRLATLEHDIDVKRAAGASVDVELAEIAALPPEPVDRTASEPLRLWVDRQRALFGAWYELFPRSEGGLRQAAENRLPAVAAMGFDVVYLPPIHPVGVSHRKGRNNTLEPGPDDPGSPWAIGSEAGGHTAVEPSLGTIEDFDAFVARTQELGMEVALDYALQCSPDHPWVKDHPEWFHHRPDGSIKYAENPPKKYQDIYPINFWPATDEARQELWQASKDVLDHWIGHGVRIFRVDNPHTKPTAFWEWIIPEVQREHPDVLFLAEAFTRPKVMAKLAEVGFTQSYTYFTWRTAKAELQEYLEEICHGPKADYMRPNFWPNTPDILSGPLRDGTPAAFKQRLVLAATMVPSYGIYSGYELCENVPASEHTEEYLYSEKYEIKSRDWDAPGSLAPYVTLLNDIRRRHPALAELRNIRFHTSNNDSILVYSKHTEDRSDVVLVVVNLDPYLANDDVIRLDLGLLGLPAAAPFEAYDEITGATFSWAGSTPYVRLDPAVEPAHILHLRT